MPNAQSVPVTPVEIPILGQNNRDPLSQMDPRTAQFINNFMPEQRSLNLRGGWKIHTTISGVDTIMALGTYQSTSLFAYCDMTSGNHTIYDVTTTTASSAEVTDSATGDLAYPANTANLLYFMTNKSSSHSTEYRYYNGSSWVDWGFQESSSDIGGYVVTHYKGRPYIFRGYNMYWGSTIGSVTGSTNLVDLSSLFRISGRVAAAGILAGPSESANELYLALFSNWGEVLVYAGDNPEATNWELIGQFKVAPLLLDNAILEYRNDIWIATTTGMVSLRKLFELGSDTDEEVSTSALINPLWSKLVKQVGIASTRCSLAYWPEENKIFVLLRGSFDAMDTYTAGTHTMFVYNAYTGAWTTSTLALLDSSDFGKLTYFNDGLYLTSANVVMT